MSYMQVDRRSIDYMLFSFIIFNAHIHMSGVIMINLTFHELELHMKTIDCILRKPTLT